MNLQQPGKAVAHLAKAVAYTTKAVACGAKTVARSGKSVARLGKSVKRPSLAGAQAAKPVEGDAKADAGFQKNKT